MGQRLDLHNLLLTITDHVYFQPPVNVEIVYPAIVYQRDDAITQFADNAPYAHDVRYQLTVIDRNPASEIPRKVAFLPKCRFSRFYVADELNHDVYHIFF